MFCEISLRILILLSIYCLCFFKSTCGTSKQTIKNTVTSAAPAKIIDAPAKIIALVNTEFRLKKTELFSVYELKSEVNPTPKDARPNVSSISSSETASSSVADVPVTTGIAGAVNTSQLWQFDKAFFPSASRNANKDENLSEASARIINQIQASKDEATTLPNDTIKVRFHCLSSRNSTLKPDSNKHTPSVIPGGLATVAILVQSRHGRYSGPGNQSTCW